MTSKQKEGFTIIEVVLVLAIAGLIFLVVFLALPALQRSQRDTSRRNDVGRLLSQVNQFQANARGNVPVAAATAPAGQTAFPVFVTNYLQVGGDTFEDPRGTAYTYSYGTTTTAPLAGAIRYATTARCGDGGVIVAGTNSRQVAASIGLEGGGAYCQQN